MKVVIKSGCLEYVDLSENVLYKYSDYNLYFEKQGEKVGIYWKNDNEIFEQYSVVKKFCNLQILKENGIAEKLKHNDCLPFDDGISVEDNEEKYPEEIKIEIEKLMLGMGFGGSKCCYVLIQYDERKACIKELVNNKTLIDNFEIKNYKKIDDYIIEIFDRDNKSFTLLSLLHGYLFGPYKYEIIEMFENGAIIDNKFLIEYNNRSNTVVINDISDFEIIESPYKVIFNNDRKVCFLSRRKYWADINSIFRLFPQKMDDEKENIEIYQFESNDYYFSFDTNTKKVTEKEFFSHGSEWTDEDAWDVLTEGQYGDYPGPYWDPEKIGF